MHSLIVYLIIFPSICPKTNCQKRLAKSKSKSLGPKISLAKLSNKKLNKLGRQGKLKKSRFGKKKLVALIKERTGKAVKPQADGSHLEKKRVDPDEIPLEEADYEYYAKPGRDFSFLSSLSKPGYACFTCHFTCELPWGVTCVDC